MRLWMSLTSWTCHGCEVHIMRNVFHHSQNYLPSRDMSCVGLNLKSFLFEKQESSSGNHPLQLAFETRPRCSCHRTGSSKGWSSNLPTRESETDCANWKSKQYQVSKSSKVASQAPLVLRHTSSPFEVWLPHWWKAETTQHSSWAWALFSLRRSLDLA